MPEFWDGFVCGILAVLGFNYLLLVVWVTLRLRQPVVVQWGGGYQPTKGSSTRNPPQGGSAAP